MSAPRPSLLDTVHGLLRRTYELRAAPLELTRFVIGDRGYAMLYGGERFRSIRTLSALGARTLVRETPDGIRATVYYPDAMIRQLERHPPQHGLSEANVDAFAVLVEELDHLLVIAERARADRPVTLFELELHANVSKHLVLSRFLAGSARRLDPAKRAWLRHHLFDGVRYSDSDPAVRRRYREAARWAVRLVDELPAVPPRRRLDTLRRFHRTSAAETLGLIRDMAGESAGA